MSSERYPSDWDQRRKRVYRRDDFTCANCGQSGGPKGDTELHAHHIVPINSGGNHATSNLVTLCEHCHRAIHTEADAPTVSTRESVAEATDTQEALNIMGRVAGEFFDDLTTLAQTLDGVTVAPDERTLDKLSEHAESLRQGSPRLKSNLNQLENFEPLYRRDDKLAELVERYVSIHRELLELAVEWLEQTEEIIDILGVTRQASCPNCAVGIAREDGTCDECGATLNVPEEDIWTDFRSTRQKLNELEDRFIEKSDTSVEVTNSITNQVQGC